MSGRQPNRSSYVKQFIPDFSTANILWVIRSVNDYINVLTPANTTKNVYIPRNLIVGGEIIHPTITKLQSDIEALQEQIKSLNDKVVLLLSP